MATWLSLVNDVQREIRVDPVTASVTSNTYSTLIGQFVNKAKREVEDAHDWTCLRTMLTVTTSSGTASYSITGSNQRSRMYEKHKVMYDDTNDGILYPAPKGYIDRMTYIGTTQTGNPVYYAFTGISSGLLQVTFWPTPDGTYTIKIPMIVPQDDLADDSSTTLTIPEAPVIERAIALARAERGEDGGTTSNESGIMTNIALSQAILTDLAAMSDCETIWSVA